MTATVSAPLPPLAAALMAIAAIPEIALGVDAEQQSLEDVAGPLSAT
jgi:hypothetical protein